MINPVHKVKRWVTYDDGREPHWTDDTAVGWLATGVIDKNGVEIHEGHIVRYNNEPKAVLPVVFEHGAFGLKSPNIYVGKIELLIFKPDKLEIIGHIAEGKHEQDN